VTSARVATAAVLIPIVVAAAWWGGTGAVAALTAVVSLLGLMEFFSLGERVGFHGYRLWTAFCAAGVLFQQWAATGAQSWTISRNLRLTRASAAPELPLELVLLIFVLGAAIIVLFSRRPMNEALGGIGISAAGLLFVVLPLSAVIRLEGVAYIGRRLLLFTLLFVWVGDTLAYFVGRKFGRMRMAPLVSPQKSWEGAAANLLGSMAVGIFLAPWLNLDVRQAVILAGLGNIAGQAGDLLESAYKRSAGVKDSGSLLPGHGGVLDRVDALILAAPVVWYYFQIVLTSRGNAGIP